MKKNIVYVIIALIVGILIGFLIFNNGAETTSDIHAEESLAEAEETQMWTCSMHPQIMQSEPGDCPICGMELIPAEDGAEELSTNEIRMTPNAMALANVQTTLVSESLVDEDNNLTLSGKIMTNEEANAVQASYFEGRIEKLHINYTGEKVRKGQLLATIYAPSLVNAQQELITTAAMKETQPDLYQAVRNKLKLWKLSESQINQIEASGKTKEIFPIYATVSGTVSQKMADEGDYVAQGQPILKLSKLNTVWAIFDAYENQISSLKVGDPITVTTQAYPENEYNAKISFIDPVMDVNSRTIAVRATLNNTAGKLKPGMFATGIVAQSGNSRSASIQVPASAVMWTGKRSLVYVKTKPNEPIFEMREVTLGQRIGESYAISEGLNKGDEVVVNGTFTVDAAAQLQGKKSMMMQSENGEHGAMTHHRVAVSEQFKNEMDGLFEDYIQLKDALVKDQATASKKFASDFEKHITQVDTSMLKESDAKESWRQIGDNLKSAVKEIASTTNIEQQRQHFIQLSQAMTHAIHVFGVNQTVYNLYCPMANSDNGAYWLSKEDKVLNPYFGEAMLSCGEVKEEIE